MLPKFDMVITVFSTKAKVMLIIKILKEKKSP